MGVEGMMASKGEVEGGLGYDSVGPDYVAIATVKDGGNPLQLRSKTKMSGNGSHLHESIADTDIQRY